MRFHAALVSLGFVAVAASGCTKRAASERAAKSEATATSERTSTAVAPSSAPPETEVAEPLPVATGARCGTTTCRGDEPTCCLDGATEKGECMSGSELDEQCLVDGVRFQLRCGHPSDCPTGSRCCIFDQMSQCGVECAHLGQMCERDEDCTALAQVTGQPARCLPLEGGPKQFSVCQVE